MRAAQFRCLDASPEPQLIVWDFGRPETATRPLRLAVVLSDDMQVSVEQRAVFARNLALNKSRGDRNERNPSVSALLNTGLFLGEYAVGTGGPLAYKTRTD